MTHLQYFFTKNPGDHAEFLVPMFLNQVNFPHALSPKRSRGPPFFLAFPGQVTHLTEAKVVKKSMYWTIFAQTSFMTRVE